jgi:hypothetical protein
MTDQFLGSFDCTETRCDPLVVFLANFDPDTAVFHIKDNGLPQEWQLHPRYQDGATFAELLDPPGVTPPVACSTSIWRGYPELLVTQCVLQIANQAVSSPGDGTGGTGSSQSGGTGGSGGVEGSGGIGGGQGGDGGQGGSDGISGGTGSSGGTDGQGGSGGSTEGASTAPGTSLVPASEAASPSTDTQPAGISEALALQQPATEPSPSQLGSEHHAASPTSPPPHRSAPSTHLTRWHRPRPARLQSDPASSACPSSLTLRQSFAHGISVGSFPDGGAIPFPVALSGVHRGATQTTVDPGWPLLSP